MRLGDTRLSLGNLSSLSSLTLLKTRNTITLTIRQLGSLGDTTQSGESVYALSLHKHAKLSDESTRTLKGLHGFDKLSL